jgi:hypothetical protein
VAVGNHFLIKEVEIGDQGEPCPRELESVD